MEEKILEIINSLLAKKNSLQLEQLDPELSFWDDLGLDSLDMAELTVKIEDEFGIDIFEDSFVYKVSDVIKKLSRSE